MPEFWDKHLEPGEKLLWTGRPQRSAAIALNPTRVRIHMTFTAVALGAFIYFYDSIIASNGETVSIIMAYWLAWLIVPIFVAGMISPRVMRYWNSLWSLRYALTTKRALIANRSGKLKVYWELQALDQLWCEPDAVMFAYRTKLKVRKPLLGASGRKLSNLNGFEMIPDADEVFELASKAAAKLG